MTKQWRMRFTVLGVVTALAVALGVSVAIVVADPPPQPSPARAGDFKPAPPPGLGPRPTTLEEEIRLRERIDRESGGRRQIVGGPETAGTILRVVGKTIKLPPDAYLVGEVWEVFGSCDPSPCPKLPLYAIKRGNSELWISTDGRIYDKLVVPGEESLFDFVREALR